MSMPSTTHLTVFIAAAFLLAIAPGPGMLYVLTRSLHAGRTEGLASSFGTAIGGLAHVIAAAFGLSALLAASAIAFGVVKYFGAAYLIYLGIRALLQSDSLLHEHTIVSNQTWAAFRQGIL